MSATLSIELPSTEYQGGDTVRGKLIYDAGNDKKIHGIHIHFAGNEFCEYSILSDIPFRKRWVRMSVIYLSSSCRFWMEPQQCGETKLRVVNLLIQRNTEMKIVKL